MTRYVARVRIDAYTDVTFDAPDQESAERIAIELALDDRAPEVSDVELQWIEEEREGG